LTAVVLASAAGWFSRREAVPAPTATATIAVLPFRSLPDSADGQLLELGLADVLISRLNQLSDVRVLPLSAAERLRSADPRQAGRTLGADRVLTGTLSGAGSRSCGVSSCRSRKTRRSAGTFDADATSAFSIQDAVVARVLQEIAQQLVRRARPAHRTRHTNGEAHESYLRTRPCRSSRAPTWPCR
jgi:TolB-like protein